MNKKGSFYFIFIFFFFTQYCNEKLNSFGVPGTELGIFLNNGKVREEEMLFYYPVKEHHIQAATEIQVPQPVPDIFRINQESLFELTMLPKEGKTVTIAFESSDLRDEKPRIIFEPTFFGNEGYVELAPLSRLVFSGDGIIEVRNGVTFDLASAHLILEKGATLQLVPDATATFINYKIESLVNKAEEGINESGQDNANEKQLLSRQASFFDPGQLIIRKDGKIVVDNSSHLIFGASIVDVIILKVDFGGQFIVDNENALVSFQQGTFDIFFSNFSLLQLAAGTIELNMCKGLSSPGFIRTWHFQTGAMLEVKNNNHGVGTLSLSNNAEKEEIDFDNQTSFVRGNGNVRFKSFNSKGDVTVDSTVQLQPHLFEQKSSMLDLFLSLSCIEMPSTKHIMQQVRLVRQGNTANSNAGELAALAFVGDGSIIPLRSGDHKLIYDSNEPGGQLSVIRGYDVHNNLFVIEDGKRHS